MKLCVAIVGPTASGKTAFALQIARALNGEIICLDSTTVYKGFDIGTAKPTAEERADVPHHLVDILNPNDPFTAFDFVSKADAVIEKVSAKGKLPIVVGGTFFYLKALEQGMYPVSESPPETVEAIEVEFSDTEGDLNATGLHEALKKVDPKAAEKIHPNDRYRLVRALSIFRSTGKKPSELNAVPLSEAQKDRLWMKYSMAISRHQLTQNIVDRTHKMLKAGLVEETRRLSETSPKARALTSIGYQESLKHLKGEIPEAQLANAIIDRTRALAKRQTTWIRSDRHLRFVDNLDLGRVVLEYKNLSHVLGSA